MTQIAKQIEEILNKVVIYDNGHYPVMVKVNDQVRCLGEVSNHDAAWKLGLINQITCEKVSLAHLPNNPHKKFYILH